MPEHGSVDDGDIRERWERFADLAGVPDDAHWLRPPVSDAALAAEESRLGEALPDDLVELLRVHNGGALFDPYDWICADIDPDGGLTHGRDHLQVLIRARGPAAPGDLLPGPRTLLVAVAGHFGILYDLDDQPGRLLHLEVSADIAVVPLARNLARVIDCFIDLAGAGFVTLGRSGPRVDGPIEEVRDIYLRNLVAPAPRTGNDAWLAWPGSADFTIDPPRT